MPEDAGRTPIVTDLPTRIISYAWGDTYIDELLSLALPALLAPGNLPYVASQVTCELTLVTEERLFAKVAAHPSIAKVQNLCPVRLIGLDDLVTRKDQYGMALTYALHRAFADLGPDSTDSWLMFLNSDFILADGSLRNLLGHLRRGECVVASPSYCTVKEDVLPQLRGRLVSDSTQLAIAPRELARLILQHRHPTLRGKTVNQGAFHLHQADQFYWSFDDDTLLGYQMPVAIVGLRPQRFLPEPNSLWDHGLISELCPSTEVKVLGDSDEFLMLELRSGDVARDQITAGRPDLRLLGERMITWVTPYQASFARRPLTLHAADLPASIEQARRELSDLVGTVLSYAPPFPSHIDHPQWTYHWPNFTRSRHACLSSQLGSSTVTHSPPQSMPEIDKLWWRLDGATKSLARQKHLIAEDRDREIECVRTTQTLGWDLANRAYANLTVRPEVGADYGHAERVETAAKRRYRNLVGPLEVEHRRLQNAYDRLLQPRVESAGPVLQPPAEALEPPVPHDLSQRMVRSLYHGLFGRWPRVTILNPFWGAAQPLLRAIERAKAAGVSDALIVSDDPGIAREIAGQPGKVTCLSTAGFASGQFRKYLSRVPQFDLFMVNLKREDLSRLYAIIDIAKPYLRPTCIVIAFHMNKGLPLEPFTLPHVNGAVVFAGSEASLRAMSGRLGPMVRVLSNNPAALNCIDLSLARRSIQVLLGLPLQLLQFWRANRAEVADVKQGRVPDSRYRSSVTVIAYAPWVLSESPFEPERINATVPPAAAHSARLNGGAKAPVELGNHVAPKLAVHPDGDVVSTFRPPEANEAG